MLHFQDNMSSESSEDRLVKIRPVLDHTRSKCMEMESENQFSIDEIMVPYKGKKAGSLQQYLPSKPKKWGFKIFVRAGVSGFVYDFMVYSGRSTFYGSTQTQGKEFGSLGTIRKNRLMVCSVEEDRDLLRRGRGSFDFHVDNDSKLAVVKWADNKTVTLVSSCASVNPVGQVRRYSKEEKRKITKSHRWYMGIFWQIVDIAVNNAWLLYRHDAAALAQKHQCLKDFRLDAGRGLIYLEKQKRGRPSKGNKDNTPEKVIKEPKVPRSVDDMRYV
ncbi:piggyBac transposable element-derived protein 3-like [Pimephales promelas]|nr:piggyBac transposable element-derived protein 3-like [Pimephales promelas]